MPPIALELDADRRCFVVTPCVDAPRRDVLKSLIEAAETTPGLGGWDCIADLRNPMTGDFEFDLQALVPLFDVESDRPPVTVMISTAARTSHWVRFLNHQFRARRHHVETSVQGALRRLALEHSRYDRLVA